MRKNDNLLILVILILIFSLIGATFAYLSVVQKYEGTFNTTVKTKGVDVIKYENIKHGTINIDFFNFRKGLVDADVSAQATMDIMLNTSKDTSNYCYNVDIILPNNQVFEQVGPGPELTLSVYENDEVLLNEIDITKRTGVIPILKNDNKIFSISATNGEKVTNKYKAVMTFKYKELDQGVNNQKTYSLVLNSHLVDCESGTDLDLSV